jgi:hypothetical protein
MADFSNTEDEIPYPLPPTMVAPTTTTAPTSAPPIVFQVPPSSPSAQNTGPFKLPKKHQTVASTKAKKHLEKKNSQPVLLVAIPVIFPCKKVFLFDDNGRNLPFGDLEWQKVVNLHNSNHGLCCTKEALQQKFNKLCNMKIPTCDPPCPADVRLAKKVAQLMVQKSNAVDLEEVPAMDKAGDDNLSVFGVYAEYDSTSVDFAKTFFNVMPVAKPELGHGPDVYIDNHRISAILENS